MSYVIIYSTLYIKQLIHFISWLNLVNKLQTIMTIVSGTWYENFSIEFTNGEAEVRQGGLNSKNGPYVY